MGPDAAGNSFLSRERGSGPFCDLRRSQPQGGKVFSARRTRELGEAPHGPRSRGEPMGRARENEPGHRRDHGAEGIDGENIHVWNLPETGRGKPHRRRRLRCRRKFLDPAHRDGNSKSALSVLAESTTWVANLLPRLDTKFSTYGDFRSANSSRLFSVTLAASSRYSAANKQNVTPDLTEISPGIPCSSGGQNPYPIITDRSADDQWRLVEEPTPGGASASLEAFERTVDKKNPTHADQI